MSLTPIVVRPLQAAAIIVLALGLSGLNVYLLKQNNELRKPKPSMISVGSSVLPLIGEDDSGRVHKIEASGEGKVLLLIFSPTCAYCERNAPNWEKIIAASKIHNFRILGVSLQRPGKRFLLQHGWESELSTINILGEAYLENPPFDLTPLTILADSNGRTEKVWRGVLPQVALDEILEIVKIDARQN